MPPIINLSIYTSVSHLSCNIFLLEKNGHIFYWIVYYHYRLVEIPAYVVTLFAAERFGRRSIINVALIGGGISLLVAGLVPTGEKNISL